MNEEEKLKKIEEEEDEFSLSEDIVLSTKQHTSSESLKTGEKKKRKFKPGKFISKHLKIKKDEKKTTPEASGESEDSSTKSPKLGILKKNIVKKLSRKKKSQVSPIESGDSSQHDEPLNNEKDLKEIENLSKNDSYTSNNQSVVNEDKKENSFEHLKLMQTTDKKEKPIPTERKSPFTENKKVQLQITISGKKIEKVQSTANEAVFTETTVSTQATDKASSSPLQYYKSQNDIMLPSTSTAVKVNKIREDFFNVMVSRDNANVQADTKSISNDALSQSVERSTVKQTNFEENGNVVTSSSEKEIEKYSLITSSLNSIIATAKDLEHLDPVGIKENIEFPQNIPELKIVEESDLTVQKEKNLDEINSELIQDKVIIKSDKAVQPFVEERIKELLAIANEKELPRIVRKGRKSLIENQISAFESQKEPEFQADEMKKSKIPINRRKSTPESAANDSPQPTVRTQEAHNPYHVHLSASTSIDGSKTSLSSEEIKFEVGTAVRPQKILSANSNNITPIIITEIESETNAQESVDDVFHSPKSEANVSYDKLGSKTRRKIAYIPQLTIYTAEEQELLKSNIIANSESFDTPSLPPDSSMFPVFDDSLVSNMTPSTPEKRECLYKILVIGELGTGKTSFIKRYVHQFFSQNYRATIGVDFALKVLNWDQSTIIRLQLWDIAGQERFGNMTRVYYKEAVGAFIVFDCTRPATFDAVNKWKTDLDSKVTLPDGSPIPCILLANKCDQPKQGLVTMPAKMDEYCKQNNFAAWYEVSAKENTNIDESAKALVSKILLNDKLIQNDIYDGERLILNAEDSNKPKKFCSC